MTHPPTSLPTHEPSRRHGAAPIPTPAQIRRRAAKIRREWDAETYEKRAVGRGAAYKIPIVALLGDFESGRSERF